MRTRPGKGRYPIGDERVAGACRRHQSGQDKARQIPPAVTRVGKTRPGKTPARRGVSRPILGSVWVAMSGALDIYLEIGKTRVFAGAIDWPGWCRSGRDEGAAQQALMDSASRYRRVMDRAHLGFPVPDDREALVVVERLQGTSTTDFGAPAAAPSADESPVGSAELRRLQEILQVCWDDFDAVVDSARGGELRKGPRGGGRDLEGIVRHVAGAEAGYLGALGFKLQRQSDDTDLVTQIQTVREATVEGLAASATGGISRRGPRGGLRWSPRYFVRRVAWHTLDHAWEIEDRVLTGD